MPQEDAVVVPKRGLGRAFTDLSLILVLVSAGCGVPADEWGGVETATAAITNPLPAGWTLTDIGAASPSSRATYVQNGEFTIATAPGRGTEAFASTGWTGDGEIVARVNALLGPSTVGMAGVEIRGSTASNSSLAEIYLLHNGRVQFTRRAGTGTGFAHFPVNGVGPGPIWLKVTRVGNELRAYASRDAVTWKLGGTATLSGIGSTARFGLVAASNTNSFTSKAVFDSVEVRRYPAPWRFTSVGVAVGSLNTEAAAGQFTVTNSGGSIAGTSDRFNFAYRMGDGGGVLTAKVNPPNRGRAGIMIRGAATNNEAHSFLYVTAASSVGYTARTAPGSSSSDSPEIAGNGPWWLMLMRSGPSVAAYASRDGANWSTVGFSTLPTIGSRIVLGLAVTGGSLLRRARATFTEVKWRPDNNSRAVEDFLDLRWSGSSVEPVLIDLAARGEGAADVEAVLRNGRSDYPEAPQPRGVATAVPIVCEHLDHTARYLIRPPTSYQPWQRSPLLIVGHGGSDQRDLAFGETVARAIMAEWTAVADANNVIMLAPISDRAWGAIGNSIIFSSLSEVQRRYNVDPDRIYITGHSMGGHLSWRSGLTIGDRWGAVGPMSGGYDYVTDRQVYNLYNVSGFATWGEFEPFGIERANRINRDFMVSHNFDWDMREKAGGGHDIFPEWIGPMWQFFAARPRNLFPSSAYARGLGSLAFDTPETRPHWPQTHVWTEGRPIPASTFGGWLRLRPLDAPTTAQTVWARRSDNRFDLRSENARAVRLYLHPAMVDFSRPVVVFANDQKVFERTVNQDVATLLYLSREFDDRNRVFHAAIDVEIATNAPVPEPVGPR